METPLITAATEGYHKDLYSLLQAGADVNQTNRRGDMALIAAAIGGHVNCLRLLIEAGADVNIPNNKNAFQ